MNLEEKLRNSVFFYSLGLGLFNPFLTLFAINIGANTFHIGLLWATIFLANSIFQLLSLPLFSRDYNKVAICIIFSLLGGLIYIPIAYTKDIYNLIFLVAAQSVFFSLSLIAWNEIVVRIYPKRKRGKEAGVLNAYSALGSIISYIIGGVVIRKFGFIPYLFYTSFLLTGIICNLFILDIKINQKHRVIRNGLKDIAKNKEFLRFTIIVSIFMFAVGLGAPLFDLHLIENIGANSVQLAFVYIIYLLVSYFFSEGVGKACDILGAKTVLLFGLPFIIVFPFLYAVGTTMTWIYLVTFVCQLGWVAFNTGLFIYISNISSTSVPSKYFAINSSIAGLFSTFGRFLAGYIAQQNGIINGLIISSIARLFSSILFFLLEEKKSHYIKLPPSYAPFYKISTYIEGFFSVYFLVVKESGKTLMENVLKKLTRIFFAEKRRNAFR